MVEHHRRPFFDIQKSFWCWMQAFDADATYYLSELPTSVYRLCERRFASDRQSAESALLAALVAAGEI